MADDGKPETERENAEGREVFVTKDESGITALAEDEDAADPRVTTPPDGESAGDNDDEETSSKGGDATSSKNDDSDDEQ